MASVTPRRNVNETRDFLYTGVGWELMDLRQDIEFHNLFMAEPYPVAETIARLAALQSEVGKYADANFPRIEDGTF